MTDVQERLVQTIRAAYPELMFATARLVSSGQFNHVVIVDEKLVFRFPRYARQAAELLTQVALLRAIRPFVTLPIPEPIYVSRDGSAPGDAFLGYPLLPGVPLQAGTPRSVGEREHLALADLLAEFLRSLHGVSASAVATPLPNLDSRERWENFHQSLRARLWAHMRPDARRAVARHFDAFLGDPRSFEYEPVIRHGDFGTGNILVDPATGGISGVVDFDSAGLGDPATDLAVVLSLGGFGEAFARRFRTTYPVDDSIGARCEFYRRTWALQEALHGIEVGDRGAFERGISAYR